MTFAITELTFIARTERIDLDSEAFFLISTPIPCVARSTLLLTEHTVPFTHLTVTTISVWGVIGEITFVCVTIGIDALARDETAIAVFTLVDATRLASKHALTIWQVIFELTDIRVSVGECEQTVSVATIFVPCAII
jgi:hypothetical protein